MTQNSLVLDFDIGNTRVKWRCFLGAGEAVTGACRYDADLEGSLSAALRVDIEDIERIRIASVAAEEKAQRVLTVCDKLGLPSPEFARVTKECGGLTPAYRCLENLGVDRWLSMLAALNQFEGPCVVVGCGTAVTVDLVSGRGLHLGGYIVPGLELMRSSLYRSTGAVRLGAISVPDNLSPGVDTAPAVSKGLLVMISELIRAACRKLREEAELATKNPFNSVKIVMTGGDAPTISPFIVGKPVYNEHLVLDGLRIALP